MSIHMHEFADQMHRDVHCLVSDTAHMCVCMCIERTVGP